MMAKNRTREARREGQNAIRRRDYVNQDQRDARQRQAQAERRRKVAALYHAGRTQEEIADALGIAQSTVSQDLAKLRAIWHEQAAAQIGEWVMRELAFAVEQRASALAEWHAGRSARIAGMVLAWSKRISDLMGLDAPTKVEDWTNQNWREFAAQAGLSEADVIREAEQIIAEAKSRSIISAAGDRAADQVAANVDTADSLADPAP